MRISPPPFDRSNKWAWQIIAMTFGWYFVLGSVAHALLWMVLTLLGLYVLSVQTYLFFVTCLAVGSIAWGYNRAASQLRGELAHFYAELSDELVTEAIRQARLTSGQHDISLEDVRLKAQKALAGSLAQVRYETIDKREMLRHPFEGAIGEITREESLRLGTP